MPNPFDKFDARTQVALTNGPQPANPFDQFDDLDQFSTPVSVDAQLAAVDAQDPVRATAAEPSFIDRALRSTALTGRAAAEGVMGLPLLAGDLLTHAVNYPLEAVTGKTIMPPSQSVAAMLDMAGAPRPETSTEQLGSAITRGITGAGTGVGASQQLAQVAGRTASNVGAQLAAQPGLQLAGGVTGATAAEGARQAGAGPVGQMVAGVAGAAAPTALPAVAAATVRGVARGGQQGAQTMQGNIQQFERAGTTPSFGQATEGRAARAAESLLSKFPGGAGRMAGAAQAQQAQLGANMDRVASGLSPTGTQTSAGRAIQGGITQDFMPSQRAVQNQLYARVDSLIPPQSPVQVSNYDAMLTRLVGGIPGAPATSGTALVSNPTVRDLYVALQADAPRGMMRYEALKGLRTRLGEMIADGGLRPDVSGQELRRLYGALTDDLTAAAQAAGPSAAQAVRRANAHTRAFHGRMDVLENVINRNGGPEKVYNAALAGSGEGATTVRAVMKSLPPESQREFVSAVVRRMGRATPGNQDDTGAIFSTNTFLTNWNKMSPEARQTLFGAFGPDFQRDMRAVAGVASNLRDGSKVFSNPSGTAGSEAALGAGMALVSGVAGGGPSAAVPALAAIGGANVTARAMTNPAFVRWLARQTRLPASALPAQINTLAQSQDPELQEIAAELQKGPSNEN
jgi:hypothetical protein